MSNAVRIHFEDALVARGRLALLTRRLTGGKAERRTFGPGNPDPVLVAHRERAEAIEAELFSVGGEDALTPAQRASAIDVARKRLKADRTAGRCLCDLLPCSRCAA